MSINNGGPAFPFDGHYEQAPGMTLRDWFATYATEAEILAIQNPPHGAKNISRYEARYIHADAMLAAREVKP
jgi:hypothetical protein